MMMLCTTRDLVRRLNIAWDQWGKHYCNILKSLPALMTYSRPFLRRYKSQKRSDCWKKRACFSGKRIGSSASCFALIPTAGRWLLLITPPRWQVALPPDLHCVGFIMMATMLLVASAVADL